MDSQPDGQERPGPAAADAVGAAGDAEMATPSPEATPNEASAEERPVVVAKRGKDDPVSKIQSELMCPICLDFFQLPVTMNCGHTFCKYCISHNAQRDRGICPVCRRPLGEALNVNTVIQSLIGSLGFKRKAEPDRPLFDPGSIPPVEESWWFATFIKPQVSLSLFLRIFFADAELSSVFFDDLQACVVDYFESSQRWSRDRWIFCQADCETFCKEVGWNKNDAEGSKMRLQDWVESYIDHKPEITPPRDQFRVTLRILPDRIHRIEAQTYDSALIPHNLPWDAGRHQHSTIHMSHPSVSLSHLMFFRMPDDQLGVVDCGSTIGTMIKVNGECAIQTGDVIHIGDRLEVDVTITQSNTGSPFKGFRWSPSRKSVLDVISQEGGTPFVYGGEQLDRPEGMAAGQPSIDSPQHINDAPSPAVGAGDAAPEADGQPQSSPDQPGDTDRPETRQADNNNGGSAAASSAGAGGAGVVSGHLGAPQPPHLSISSPALDPSQAGSDDLSPQLTHHPGQAQTDNEMINDNVDMMAGERPDHQQDVMMHAEGDRRTEDSSGGVMMDADGGQGQVKSEGGEGDKMVAMAGGAASSSSAAAGQGQEEPKMHDGEVEGPGGVAEEDDHMPISNEGNEPVDMMDQGDASPAPPPQQQQQQEEEPAVLRSPPGMQVDLPVADDQQHRGEGNGRDGGEGEADVDGERMEEAAQEGQVPAIPGVGVTSGGGAAGAAGSGEGLPPPTDCVDLESHLRIVVRGGDIDMWIDPRGVVLGRGPHAQSSYKKVSVTANNGYVSREHCLIFYDGDRPAGEKWVLRDMSTLGTFLRVKPYGDPVPILRGSQFKAGQCKIEVGIGNNAAENPYYEYPPYGNNYGVNGNGPGGDGQDDQDNGGGGGGGPNGMAGGGNYLMPYSPNRNYYGQYGAGDNMQPQYDMALAAAAGYPPYNPQQPPGPGNPNQGNNQDPNQPNNGSGGDHQQQQQGQGQWGPPHGGMYPMPPQWSMGGFQPTPFPRLDQPNDAAAAAAAAAAVPGQMGSPQQQGMQGDQQQRSMFPPGMAMSRDPNQNPMPRDQNGLILGNIFINTHPPSHPLAMPHPSDSPAGGPLAPHSDFAAWLPQQQMAGPPGPGGMTSRAWQGMQPNRQGMQPPAAPAMMDGNFMGMGAPGSVPLPMSSWPNQLDQQQQGVPVERGSGVDRSSTMMGHEGEVSVMPPEVSAMSPQSANEQSQAAARGPVAAAAAAGAGHHDGSMHQGGMLHMMEQQQHDFFVQSSDTSLAGPPPPPPMQQQQQHPQPELTGVGDPQPYPHPQQAPDGMLMMMQGGGPESMDGGADGQQQQQP